MAGFIQLAFYLLQKLFICQMDFEHILDDLYLQLNECRLHPQDTANKLGQLRDAYQGNVFKNQYKTREGRAALDNLIHDFSQRPPALKRLKWSYALHMAADEQASILGQKGIFTTEGTPFHKTLPQRVKDYAIVKGRLSQIYEFGGRTPNQILQQLLIDDGLTSRKRRNTLMDPIFNYVGIASSYHQSQEACTVIILAEDIVSLVAPDATGKYKRRRGIQTGKETAVKLIDQVVLNNVLDNLLPGALNISASQSPILGNNPSTSAQGSNSRVADFKSGGETVTYNNTTNRNTGNPWPGETVTYHSNENTGINRNTTQPNTWQGGDTVTYGANTNTNNRQVNGSTNLMPRLTGGASNTNLITDSRVDYSTNAPGGLLTQSQLQKKQYELYKEQEPTITISSPDHRQLGTVDPSTNIGTSGDGSLYPRETHSETKSTEEKSKCAVM